MRSAFEVVYYYRQVTKKSMMRLDFLHLESWWKRLLQLFSLLSIINDEGVEVSTASNLELGHVVLVLLDLH